MTPNISKAFIATLAWTFLLISSWTVPPVFAQQKSDPVLVYGQDFVFSVKEPAGWNADTQGAAKFDANVVLREAGQPVDVASGLIRITINDKADENTGADLKADIQVYKKKYPKVRFKDLSVENPKYLCLGKVFYIPGEFYEYVAYINPGRGKPLLFSVSMNVPKSEASAAQLEAFKSAIRSLTLLKP